MRYNYDKIKKRLRQEENAIFPLAARKKYGILQQDATVAQSVEQLIRNQQVAGSSPASSSRKALAFCRCFFFCLFYEYFVEG